MSVLSRNPPLRFVAFLPGEAGPRRDIAVLNAAAAIVVAGKSQPDLKEGVAQVEPLASSPAGPVDARRAHPTLTPSQRRLESFQDCR